MKPPHAAALNQVELQCDDPKHFVKTYGVAPRELDSFLNALRPRVPNANFDI